LPIYEYKCEGCGETFEVIQKFADEPVAVHEKCGGHVHRLMSAPSFQFKGTGWYVTDYAKGGSSPASKGEGKGESGKGESSKGDGKSDSGKSESSDKSDSSSKSESATKTESKSESKPAASSDKSKSD
jgi:putative FmdB family regulatory protein